MKNTILMMSLGASLLMLTGCEDPINYQTLCEQYPEFCADLNTDGWCRQERTQVVLGRYYVQQDLSDKNQYKLLTAFKDYKVCIERAAQIEPIKHKSRKTNRVLGLLTAVDEIKRLNQETQHSNDPQLLYYHWQQNNDQRAKYKFLSYEGTGKLDTPELQLALATHYFSSQPERTIQILYRAMALHTKAHDHIMPATYQSLPTLFLQLKQFDNAYIWAYIAGELGNAETNLDAVKLFKPFSDEEIEKLEAQAEQLLKQLKRRRFTPPSDHQG